FEGLDSYCIDDGTHKQLGRKPAAQILKLLATNKRTKGKKKNVGSVLPRASSLLVYRDGAREQLNFQLRYSHERAGRYLPNRDLHNIVTVHLQCGGAEATASPEKFTQRFLPWLTTLLDEIVVVHEGQAGRACTEGLGFYGQRDSAPSLDPVMHLDETTSHSLGWMMILGPHHERLFSREDLLSLPTLLENPNPSLGVKVHATKRNVVVITDPSPLGAPPGPNVDDIEEARALAIRPALTEIFRRGFL